ncbi:MAG: zf-HC2 domain-containing protein [Wujia sp.]
MTCLEAQSNIMMFIEKKLPDDVIPDFVRHMRYCKNCFEELEIYYTLIVGMHQVDNNQELSQNFKKDLEQELNRLEHKVKSAKRFKVSTFGISFIASVMLLFFLYNQCLEKVYTIEQRMKLESQGETYFYDTFGEEMTFCMQDIISDSQAKQKKTESTFYEKLREYQRTHPQSEESESE